MLRQFVGFILAPADAMEATLSPYWSPSHTIWLVLSLLLSGLAYVNFYRVVVFLVSGSVVAMSAGRFFLSWLTGIALTGAVLLLNTLTIWLISRFMFHQGRLPFTHALAAGRTSWKYLVLFLVIALPSTFSPGSLFGLVLAGIGIIFSIILHGRLVARLTRLDDNRTIQLILLSMLVFAGLSSTALLVFNLSMV